MEVLKETIEDWSKPFVACLLGMTSGIDLSLGHLFIATKTATITLVLGLIIKKVKGS
jgi:hypothetical protein